LPFRFTVMLCVHRPPVLLPFALETVLAQSHANFELFVVCDGAPPETAECARAYAAHDGRIRVFDFPKGERHGEAYRHIALAEASGDFVAHIADDDLWFPDHLRELGTLLTAVEFGNLFLVSVLADSTLWHYFGDLADPATRHRMLEQRWNFFGPTVAGYRLSTYRKLPVGWAPAPPDTWCDLHMWRKFLQLEGISVGTRFCIQSIALENGRRSGMTLEDRRAETERWFNVVRSPKARADFVAECWATVVKRQLAIERELQPA
jgi:glycosyltransferase involved in cell wall biosynthesis